MFDTLIRTLLAAVLALGATTPTPDVQLLDMPEDFEEIAVWSVGLFEEAGLDLPRLRFAHHGDDRSQCAGRIGTHAAEEHISVIRICTTDPSFATQVMILHETAHAWADHSLTDARKAAFKELRGFEHWRNYEAAAWHENGTEQAAEIMVWGLIDTPIGMARIYQNSCSELESGYEALTGMAPLHGFTDYC